MSIEKTIFGTTKDGREVTAYSCATFGECV